MSEAAGSLVEGVDVAFLGGYAAGRCKGRACSCRVPHTPGGWKGVCCKSERLRSERRARCM